MTDSVAKALETALDVEPTPALPAIIEDLPVPTVSKPDPTDQESEEDAAYVRTNIKAIIDKGTLALDSIVNLAIEGEHPRAFEAVSQLIDSLTASNKALLDIHKSKQDLKKTAPPLIPASGTAIQNAIFVGSTAEMQKLINARKTAG